MKLSILTATYNREKYLQRLYDSIMQNLQTSKLEIEWIIIDDGSADSTKNRINELEHNALEQPNNIKNRIQIKYIYQQNLGKMAAINKGVNEAIGELIIDCDSDDFFAENAFNIIERNASKLLQKEKLYALCFLKKDFDNNISR